MKKLLASALTLTVVAGAVIWRTGAFFSDTETSNDNTFTAGGLDLQIDSEAHYNHMVCVNNEWLPEDDFKIPENHYPIQGAECSGTWSLKDLEGERFFDFADVKPGDAGENTISLHVNNNDAWACVDVTNVRNEDNSLTDPETQNGDTLLTGELAQNMQFFAWQDNGDNIWQAQETPYTPNPVSGSELLNGDFTVALAAPGVLPAITGGQTKYVGVAWCIGTMDTSTPGEILCSGDSVGNDVQTDSLIADISFRIEQARNNPNFSCRLPDKVVKVTSVGDYENPQDWYFYNDETDVIDPTLGSFVAGPSTPPAGSGSVEMSVSGTQRRNLATYKFSATPLAYITAIQFSTYQPSSNPGSINRAIYLNFNVDFDGSDTWQRRLVFVPSVNGSVAQDTWQEWDAIQGGTAKWLYSGTTWPGTATPGTTTKTWDQILSEYPGVRVRVTDSHWGFRAGEPYADGFTGNIDKFVFGVNGVNTTYDFENL